MRPAREIVAERPLAVQRDGDALCSGGCDSIWCARARAGTSPNWRKRVSERPKRIPDGPDAIARHYTSARIGGDLDRGRLILGGERARLLDGPKWASARRAPSRGVTTRASATKHDQPHSSGRNNNNNNGIAMMTSQETAPTDDTLVRLGWGTRADLDDPSRRSPDANWRPRFIVCQQQRPRALSSPLFAAGLRAVDKRRTRSGAADELNGHCFSLSLSLSGIVTRCSCPPQPNARTVRGCCATAREGSRS